MLVTCITTLCCFVIVRFDSALVFYVLAVAKTGQVLLKLVLELKAEMRHVRSELREVKEQLKDIRSGSLLNIEENDTDGSQLLPLSAFSDVEALEEKLSLDQRIKQQLVSINLLHFE